MNSNKIITLLLFLSITLIFIWFQKDTAHTNEGFSQATEFLLKEGDDAFDEFYSQIYNTIHKPWKFVDSVSDSIIKYTNIDKEISSVLLVSSDTGEQSNSLQSKGLNVDSLFKHEYMFNHAKRVYPNIHAQLANFKNMSMTYDKSSFSHILCLGNIIYTIQDKKTFFRYIYNWLVPGGFFLIQLADRSKFNTIKTSNNLEIIDSPQKYHDERITDSEINFGSFKYLSKYDFKDAETKNIVYFSETFTDNTTNNVRKNEHILHMENIDEILSMASLCGFEVLRKINIIEDEHQFIYILHRKH